MLTRRYMASVKNLPAIMKKITEGTAPGKFTQAHLKGIGFKSTNDRGIIPLLKDLGFLSGDGVPTQRYHAYRDPSRSRTIMGTALREAYEDLFHINERPTDKDRKAIKGKFMSVHNVKDALADFQTTTFFTLLKLADLDAVSDAKPLAGEDKAKEPPERERKKKPAPPSKEIPLSPFGGLRYNIEIHLPATNDSEVYNAIFKSLKEHLLED